MLSDVVLRRTQLFDEHIRLGGRMVPFAGFEMPVQYTSIVREHDVVRERAGLFDLSHMAQFELRGEDVPAWADALTINSVSGMKPLQARYNIFCNARGGALDDVIFYRLPDRWLLVVNAANVAKMWAYLTEVRSGDVRLSNQHGKRALIAIQGPRSAEIVALLCAADIFALRYYFCVESSIEGIPAVIARTGYTGEDGFEFFIEGEHAPGLWRRLLEAGSALGLEAAGLGARDMLRLEAGMPLYGHELSEEITPVAGGQAWALKFSKPDFVGRQALADQVERDGYDRIVGLVMDGRAPARSGYRVMLGERVVGEIRSASLAPSLGNRQIATALLEKDACALGIALSVEIRGTAHAAHVVSLPFYRRKSVTG